MVRNYRNYSKIWSGPRRPFEKERLDRELRLCGEFGLRSKREVWKVQYVLAKIRKAARDLLTLPEDDPKRQLEGAALLRRMTRLGLLDETKQKLDYVLSLKIEDFLERRLQTLLFKRGLAVSVHHARVLINQRHIRVGKQIVNIPSFLVRTDSEKHISLAPTSTLRNGKPGRTLRKKQKAAKEASSE